MQLIHANSGGAQFDLRAHVGEQNRWHGMQRCFSTTTPRAKASMSGPMFARPAFSGESDLDHDTCVCRCQSRRPDPHSRRGIDGREFSKYRLAAYQCRCGWDRVPSAAFQHLGEPDLACLWTGRYCCCTGGSFLDDPFHRLVSNRAALDGSPLPRTPAFPWFGDLSARPSWSIHHRRTGRDIGNNE